LHLTVQITPEVTMRIKRARRVRSAAISFAAIVALSAAASPAVARVRVPIRPTVDDHAHYGDRNGVEPRGELFRGRYQLQLSQARKRTSA
jgi:hypothetical protein